MSRLFLLVAVLLTAMGTTAQRGQGSWQDYLSFANATKVAVSPNKIYCVTEGGLFYYDLEDNSINKLSPVEGLSDFGINTVAYSEENQVLIVAYKNSNIDLVFESGVVNLSDIRRKQITGNKTIYNITVSGNEAFLSCGFGIVAVNLDRREIKDTYYIGNNGSSLRVNDVAVFNESIFAATNDGLIQAAINDNLLNYNSWKKISAIPHSNDKFSQLVVHQNRLIANYSPDEWYQDEMYILNGNTWAPYLPQIKFAFDMQTNAGYLAIASRSNVFIIDSNDNVIGNISNYSFSDKQISPIEPRSAVVSNEGNIWVADFQSSLVKITGEQFERIFPNGPMDNKVFNLTIQNGMLWMLPGGRSDSWNNAWEKAHFQLFDKDKWHYFTDSEYTELADFNDLVEIAVDPANPSHYFIGSWGGGVLEFRDGQLTNHFTNLNSPLETANPDNPSEPYTRIGGLDFDREGNLWIVNSQVAENLLKLTPDGDWETFELPEIANNFQVGDVLVTQNNDKWILAPRGHDAYVVDETGTQKKRLLVTSYFNNGVREQYTRMNDVYSIVEDNDGAIWIGTSKGVAVYNNPRRIWNDDEFYAIQPSLDLNDGIYHPLLETETVTAIAVDGGNRKWLGTSNSGIYLVSESGEEEILHFTKENSPLLSNTITAIAIDQKTGEVFIGTDEGLISYQGAAIEGKESYANVYVYPNPVRGNYDGPVTITGLIEQTDVKITDISGNLVYKTTSLGGQAVWDGSNLNGKRVKTGVYLVFCNDDNGEETHITKLLFIN